MKNILVFCDGTSENISGGSDDITSNIARLYNLAVKDDTQITHYVDGVGSCAGYIKQKVFQATGFGMRKTIIDCYRFIAENYKKGDSLYFFGFSRGSYTARSTIGFINLFGIQRYDDGDNYSDMYDIYRTPPDDRHDIPHSEKYLFKIGVVTPRTKFVGVFDTVGALGIPTAGLQAISNLLFVGFHDTSLNGVDYAYQALAIDERRKPFSPSVWTKADDPELKELQQVWFSGSHTDVGGGYQDRRLSDITLTWMFEKASKVGARFEKLPVEVQPDFEGGIRDSFTRFWITLMILMGPWTTGPIRRKIGRCFKSPDGYAKIVNEYIHHTAIQRLNKGLDGYNKENLADFANNIQII